MMPNILTPSTSVPFLSITIPTYNRSARLRQCLLMLEQRIAELSAPAPLVEVLVVDNASTDDTTAVVEAARGSFTCLSYVRNDTNLGIDGNIHRCSQLAHGTWVQLLSDDDILLPDTLRHVVENLTAHPQANFFFLNVITFVDELPPPADWKPRIVLDQNLVCHNANDIVTVCGIWLTFLSSFVFRRESWSASPRLLEYIGTDIYLSYALFDLLASARETVVLARPLVAARACFSGNYRIFYAFGHQWPELLLTHAPTIGFDATVMQTALRRSIRSDLLSRVLHYRLNVGELKAEERRYVFHGAQQLSISTVLLWVAMVLPHWLLRGVRIVIDIFHLRRH